MSIHTQNTGGVILSDLLCTVRVLPYLVLWSTPGVRSRVQNDDDSLSPLLPPGDYILTNIAGMHAPAAGESTSSIKQTDVGQGYALNKSS